MTDDPREARVEGLRRETWFVNLDGGVRALVEQHASRAARPHLLAALDEAVRRLEKASILPAPGPSPEESENADREVAQLLGIDGHPDRAQRLQKELEASPGPSPSVRALLVDIAQIFDGCRQAAPADWTDWDQLVRDRISAALKGDQPQQEQDKQEKSL